MQNLNKIVIKILKNERNILRFKFEIFYVDLYFIMIKKKDIKILIILAGNFIIGSMKNRIQLFQLQNRILNN